MGRCGLIGWGDCLLIKPPKPRRSIDAIIKRLLTIHLESSGVRPWQTIQSPGRDGTGRKAHAANRVGPDRRAIPYGPDRKGRAASRARRASPVRTARAATPAPEASPAPEGKPGRAPKPTRT